MSGLIKGDNMQNLHRGAIHTSIFLYIFVSALHIHTYTHMHADKQKSGHTGNTHPLGDLIVSHQEDYLARNRQNEKCDKFYGLHDDLNQLVPFMSYHAHRPVIKTTQVACRSQKGQI